MRKPRGNLSSGMALAMAGAATTWVAMISWAGFTSADVAYLVPLMILGATVAATGAVARWWRLPAVAVIALQLVASGLMFSLFITGSPVPVQGAWTELVSAFSNAVDSAREYAAPVPSRAPGIHPLLISGGLAAMLVVDLLAGTARKVPLAGLPLLTIYSVPISLLDGGVSVWVFVLTAVGFLSMLYLHENDQINRWGRPIGSDPESAGAMSSFGVRTGIAKSNAGAIGSVATALAVVVPLAIPTFDLNVLGFGQGSGSGSGVKIENPTADLLRDLIRGEDKPLIRVTTDDPDPNYLRVTSLNRFSDDQWSPGDRDIPSENRPDGAMPPLQGVSGDVDRTEYSYELAINDQFEAAWLPTQAPISAITADGDWRFDERSMDFFRWDEDLDTRGMDYSMTAVELDLRAAELADAPLSNDVDDEFLDLPAGLPDIVERLAIDVTNVRGSRFEKAVALQNWFRDNFSYSLTNAPTGNGANALEEFLSEEGRVGYCEQFAASMAVMARVLKIPARVAVGFLEPDPLGGGVWEYSSDDLHAWPELYFDGYGWVRFEPTPAARAEAVPGYTTEQVPAGPTSLPSPGVTTNPTERPTTSREPAATPSAGEDAGAGDDAAFPWLPVAGGVGGGLVLVALALTPRLMRRRAREMRLDAGPEAAWDELRATVIDLRQAWPTSRSPRETRDRLVQLFGAPGDEFRERPARGPRVNPDAVVAVDRIVRDLELLRYSRSHAPEAGTLRDEVETCIEALEAGVTPRVRRRAMWLPRSVRSGERRRASALGEEPVRTPWGGVVEHMG